MSQTPNTRKRDTSEEMSQTQISNKLPFRLRRAWSHAWKCVFCSSVILGAPFVILGTPFLEGRKFVQR